MKYMVLGVLLAAAVAGFAMTAGAEFDKPVIKEWTKMEPNEKGEMKEVRYMTIDGVMVHETDPALQPPPPVVTPGTESSQEKPGVAPSDAVVLFDGKDLANWTSTSGAPTKWIVTEGAMSPTKKSGMVQSKQEFGSCQLHVEFATPKQVEGDSQGRGNSGVFLMGKYEVQVLDSYENATYPDGQAAALYGRAKPLVNACRKPGEWQSYDIIFHRPIFENGEVIKRATFTILHNGVVVQDHTELSGGTDWRGGHAISNYEPHADKGPIRFQDHGNPVLFRNVWVRELQD
ncbi:MAG TPA: DUF1080 domain-containing protein [Candidatus Bathyarchaeia archaeon]|nr:DUF1080 domain-containing protein [Candidatus Bathyarchaeia archaeon]